MKKIIIISGLCFGGIVVPTASADVGQAICGYVASDHKSRLRDQLRSNKIRLKKVYKTMTCNGHSLLRFAMTNEANEAGTYIAKRLSPSSLANIEPDGKTVLGWAEENGKMGSKIVDTIKKRLSKIKN